MFSAELTAMRTSSSLTRPTSSMMTGGSIGMAAESLASTSPFELPRRAFPGSRPGGRLVLYTGTPIVRGADPLFDSLQRCLQLYASHFVYEEIDPDVFGEELDRPAYANADRIAAVGLTAIKRG